MVDEGACIMAGLYQYTTSKGTFWRVNYTKPDGTPTTRRGFTTKRDAKLFAAENDVSQARGEWVDPTDGKKTVRHYAELYKQARLANLKPSSRNVMETTWRIHVEPHWGNRQVSTIKKSQVAAWVGTKNTERSPQTVRRMVFVLSGILELAVDDRAIVRNPTVGVQLPAKIKKPARYLTHQQVELLAKQLKEDEKSTIVRFLAYTGLRWGELAALRVQDVDLVKNRVTVEQNAVLVSGVYEIGTPKTGKSRTLGSAPFLAFLLRPLMKDKPPEAYVFGDGQTVMRYPNAGDGWFVGAVKRARKSDKTFPEITLHDLRHTAASLAVSAGANVKAVQRMLGHASAAMTLDVYADLFDEDMDAVATELGNARSVALGA